MIENSWAKGGGVDDRCEVYGKLGHTRADLLRALVERGQDSPVSDVMQRDFATADVNEILEDVAVRLSAGACHSLPVTRNGGLVGMITMENVGEFLMIQGAPAEACQRHEPRSTEAA